MTQVGGRLFQEVWGHAEALEIGQGMVAKVEMSTE